MFSGNRRRGAQPRLGKWTDQRPDPRRQPRKPRVFEASARRTLLRMPLRPPLSASLASFAALASLTQASGAFAAQGTVGLYGVLDSSIEVTNPGNGWTPRLDSGAYRGSRIGLRGAEPIGGGTRILFDLESGFSASDGALSTSGTLFGRQAWIGAGGPWGEARFGRQYSPLYIPFKGQLDAFGAGTIASGLNNLSKITPYVSNAVTYLSPTLMGLSGTVMLALRSAADDGSNGLAGNYETVAYHYGPLRLSYAHQQTHGAGALRANMGGASYTLGRATGFVAFFNGDSRSARYHNDGVSVSLRYAFAPQFRASLGYAFARDRSGRDNDADQFSVACEYDVSKRLMFYASGAWLRNRADAAFTLRGSSVTGLPASTPGAPVRGVQFGMIERF